MSKLVQLVSLLSCLLSLWLGVYYEAVAVGTGALRTSLLLSPLLLLATFCLYSVLVIAYRVATFNDCEEAALELQKQISEARMDLRSKGFVFEE